MARVVLLRKRMVRLLWPEIGKGQLPRAEVMKRRIW
jgi:hypothetical protein